MEAWYSLGGFILMMQDVTIRTQIEDQIGEEQHGFRKGRSTTDTIFTLRQHTQQHLEYDLKLVAGFINLIKAYNSPKRVSNSSPKMVGYKGK